MHRERVDGSRERLFGDVLDVATRSVAPLMCSKSAAGRSRALQPVHGASWRRRHQRLDLAFALIMAALMRVQSQQVLGCRIQVHMEGQRQHTSGTVKRRSVKRWGASSGGRQAEEATTRGTKTQARDRPYPPRIFRRSTSGRCPLRMCSTSHCTAGFTPSPVRAVMAWQRVAGGARPRGHGGMRASVLAPRDTRACAEACLLRQSAAVAHACWRHARAPTLRSPHLDADVAPRVRQAAEPKSLRHVAGRRRPVHILQAQGRAGEEAGAGRAQRAAAAREAGESGRGSLRPGDAAPRPARVPASPPCPRCRGPSCPHLLVGQHQQRRAIQVAVAWEGRGQGGGAGSPIGQLQPRCAGLPTRAGSARPSPPPIHAPTRPPARSPPAPAHPERGPARLWPPRTARGRRRRRRRRGRGTRRSTCGWGGGWEVRSGGR